MYFDNIHPHYFLLSPHIHTQRSASSFQLVCLPRSCFFFYCLFCGSVSLLLLLCVHVYQGLAHMSQLHSEGRGQLYGISSFPSTFVWVPGIELLTRLLRPGSLPTESSCWPFTPLSKDPLGLIGIAWMSMGEGTWASYTTEEIVSPSPQQTLAADRSSGKKSKASGASLVCDVMWCVQSCAGNSSSCESPGAMEDGGPHHSSSSSASYIHSVPSLTMFSWRRASTEKAIRTKRLNQ